jgi:hypothetical protein
MARGIGTGTRQLRECRNVRKNVRVDALASTATCSVGYIAAMCFAMCFAT